MKILVDENIPEGDVRALRKQTHSVKRVKKGNPDANILTQAKDGGRILVTFDQGFKKLANEKGLPKNGIVLISGVDGVNPDTLNKFIVESVRKNQNIGRKLIEVHCNSQRAKPKTSGIESQIADAIIKKLPVGRFKSTDCRHIISNQFPKHKMAKMTDAEFGTEFLKTIWPRLKKRGVVQPRKKPVRYEITKAAKNQ